MDSQQQEYYKILLIGDSCVDKFHYGKCNRLSPEAPVPVLIHSKTEEMGGMVHNVKNNLLGFGSRVSVDVLTNHEQILKERFVEEKSGQHIMRYDSGEDEKVNALDLKEEKINNIAQYDLVIISDYEKGYVTPDVALRLCELCLLYDIPLFVDTKKRDLTCFKGSIVKINETEYKKMSGNFPKQHLIITKGPDGALWDKKIFPTNPAQVVDVSGAGDTFLAVLALEYVRFNRKMETAIILANKAASYVVQKSGTYSLKEKDIEKLRL